MAINVQSRIITQPSRDIPGLIMPFSQPSGAFNLLYDGAPEILIGEEDLAVYVRNLNIRTATLVGQAGSNQMPGVDIDAEYQTTAAYLFRNRIAFDHHEANMAGNWGFPVDSAYVHGMNQGHFQQMRIANLYGVNPSNGEGLLNTNGATKTSLPPDPFNNTTFSTYDNGAMYQFMLQVCRQLMTLTYQFGQPQKISIVGPQREIATWQTAVVQLTSYQRDGAGTDTIASAIKDVMKKSGVDVEFSYDDTLIGQGSGGKDAIIITLPKVNVPKMVNQVDTNYFAKLQPSIDAANVMYSNVAMPTQKRVPLSMGFTEIMTEIRVTSGWGLRGEAITILSGAY